MSSGGLDRDALFMVPRDDAAIAAYEGLTAIQKQRPHEMVAGVAVLFAAICNRVGLDPQEVHALGMKLLRTQGNHTRANNTLQSLRDFAGVRIKGERNVEVA